MQKISKKYVMMKPMKTGLRKHTPDSDMIRNDISFAVLWFPFGSCDFLVLAFVCDLYNRINGKYNISDGITLI